MNPRDVVDLQALLMGGVRQYRAQAEVARQAPQLLASAAALDYVLMLATHTAGTPVPAAQAERAIRDGVARAVDDALQLLRAIADTKESAARAFVRDGLPTLRKAIEAQALADDERRFALIALAGDVSW